jgi:hypothetical protein
MVIEYPLWRIKSYQYGYQVDRKINVGRWKAEGYYIDLRHACQSLLEHRVRAETTEYIIKANDQASARLSTARLVEKIDTIVEELLGGLDQWK